MEILRFYLDCMTDFGHVPCPLCLSVKREEVKLRKETAPKRLAEVRQNLVNEHRNNLIEDSIWRFLLFYVFPVPFSALFSFFPP